MRSEPASPAPSAAASLVRLLLTTASLVRPVSPPSRLLLTTSLAASPAASSAASPAVSAATSLTASPAASPATSPATSPASASTASPAASLVARRFAPPRSQKGAERPSFLPLPGTGVGRFAHLGAESTLGLAVRGLNLLPLPRAAAGLGILAAARLAMLPRPRRARLPSFRMAPKVGEPRAPPSAEPS